MPRRPSDQLVVERVAPEEAVWNACLMLGERLLRQALAFSFAVPTTNASTHCSEVA